MVAKLVVLLAACFICAQAGLARRDAPDGLQQLQKNADEFAKTFNEQINSFVNSKNTQDFNKALKESSDVILQQVSDLSKSLQGALTDANGKAKEALERARADLERTTAQLKQQHPEVEQQATALRENIQRAVQDTLQHTQHIAKEVAAGVDKTNEQLAPKIKAAYEDFIKQAQDVQKKLHEAANKQ